jgi:hypothetical protein
MTKPASIPSVASEPWLTKGEIARKLGISTRTVVRLRLPYMQVGGQNRYRMSECERFMRRGETGGAKVVELRPSRQGDEAA